MKYKYAAIAGILMFLLGYILGVKNYLRHFEVAMWDQARIMVAQRDIRALTFVMEQEEFSTALDDYPCQSQKMLRSLFVSLDSCVGSKTCADNLRQWIPEKIKFVLDGPIDLSRSLNRDCVR